MGTPDFLRKRAETPWTERFLMAGVSGTITTNSQDILAAARSSFCPPNGLQSEPQMHLRLWVDPEGSTRPPWPKPTFRGLDHLIFAGLDPQNSILIDLHRKRAIGRLSPAMAADQNRWQTVIFPNLLTLLGPAVGVTGLHCACVVRDGEGLLLTGLSGAGKSTLTLAMAQRGYSFLSDDWTYFSRYDGSLRAWGLIPRLKLLPDSAGYFPELADFQPVLAVNGESAIEIDPSRNLGISRSQTCKPRALIFLERRLESEFNLTPMPAAAAIEQLEQTFLADRPEALQSQSEIVRSVAGLGSWHLRYGEPPDAVAHKLADFFSSSITKAKL